MALIVTKPYVTVADANGLPYVGAQLYVYLVGTTTLASIYTNEGLTTPADNPSTSNAKGEFPRLYITAGNYKLRCETSAGVLIFEEDHLDTGLSAGSGALPIASGGTGGTTATSARTNLDVPSNSELADLASDITTIQSTLQTIVSTPQGYLTPTSAVPVITTGVTAGTSVYYTPFRGNLIPIWDGTQFNTVSFTELTLTLNSNHTASNIYDVYVFENSSSVTIGTGPAWNTATAGAGARGTGAGTTELTLTKGGLWTNAYTMTVRNGATTYSVNANCGTYVGSIFIDGTNGQITCHRVFGQSRKWAIWNAHNRQNLWLQAGDTTASWTYNVATWRSSNNDSNNKMTVFSGLSEESIHARFFQFISAQAATGQSAVYKNGIGYNSTTVPSGQTGSVSSVLTGGTTTTVGGSPTSFYKTPPFIGINTFSCLEIGTAGGPSGTFTGAEQFMCLTAEWFG